MVKAEVTEDGEVFIEGAVMKLDETTANGRVYPKALFERELKRVQKQVDLGLEYVFSYEPGSSYPMSLSNAAAVIESISINGNEVWLRAKVVKGTLPGDLVRFLVIEKRDLGMDLFPAGVGSVGDDGVVNDDYHLNFVQIAPIPSGPAVDHES